MTDTERFEAMFADTELADPDPESLLGRAMVLAQRTADVTIADARAEADRILRDARSQARQLDGLLHQVRGQVAALSQQLAVVEAAAASARLEATVPVRQIDLRGREEMQPAIAAASTPAPPVSPSFASPSPPADRESEPPPSAHIAPEPEGRFIGPVPVEAILPMVAIVIVLIVVLAWLG